MFMVYVRGCPEAWLRCDEDVRILCKGSKNINISAQKTVAFCAFVCKILFYCCKMKQNSVLLLLLTSLRPVEIGCGSEKFRQTWLFTCFSLSSHRFPRDGRRSFYD